MPASITVYFNNHFINERYNDSKQKYLDEFVNEFIKTNHQNRREAMKRVNMLLKAASTQTLGVVYLFKYFIIY